MKANIDMVNEIAAVLQNLWLEDEVDDLKEMLIHSVECKDEEVFVVRDDHRYIGVAMCSLRFDYVEGCKSSPVGYLEGIYVDQNYRNKGIARLLLSECEVWAKEKGCLEFASDCEMDNLGSLAFHLHNGFEEANRIIHFKKNL